MKVLAGSSWGFTTETLVATYKAIPSLTMPPPSGSPNCSSPIWTSLRWSRTKPWGLWPDAIKRPRRPTSGQRLGSSPWGRTYNYAGSSSMLAPSKPYTQVTSPSLTPAFSGLPSRPNTTAHSESCESEVMTLTPPSHLRGHGVWGHLPSGQTPLPGPDDRGDHPVPGDQQKCLWLPPLQLTQLNNFYHGHTTASSPSSVPANALGFSPTATAPSLTCPWPWRTSPPSGSRQSSLPYSKQANQPLWAPPIAPFLFSRPPLRY